MAATIDETHTDLPMLKRPKRPATPCPGCVRCYLQSTTILMPTASQRKFDALPARASGPIRVRA
jgi:hypothetical protein